MKRPAAYVGSFIISILVVFALIASFLAITVNSVNADKLVAAADDKGLASMVENELERYFNERKNTTGIPANVYMDSIDEEYLSNIIQFKINSGFSILSGDVGDEFDMSNIELENNISEFFSEYAESIGYEKDNNYDVKLMTAQKSAYTIIEEYCDVYKFGAMERHGVLKKAAPLYQKLSLIIALCIIASAALAIILFVINIKEIKNLAYWIGTSAVVSGAMGAIPCIYLLASDYFSAFTIKQPQIFTAYTTLMKDLTSKFMTFSIASVIIGIVLFIVCAIMSKFIRKSESQTES